DLEMLDILRFRLGGKEVRTVLAPKGRIKGILDELFNTTAANTIDKTMDRTIDRLRDSLDKSVDKSLDKSVDRSIDRSIDVIDIAEKRLPQDGRIKLSVDKQSIDFRVSTLPAYHGESVVLRILRPDSVRIGIQNLGFEEEDYKAFQKIIRRPNGIFLVTGPTGSGKTTTLYGALNELNRPDRKIITAEDPVEYNFVGINQCQVKDN